MAVAVDQDRARELLEQVFEQAEQRRLAKLTDEAADAEAVDLDLLFTSRTAAYRQALLGVALVKQVAPSADLALPSIEHGARAYSGRSLDEAVIIPSLARRLIPATRTTPYLSVLRRGKRFIDDDVVGTQDRNGYFALNRLVASLQRASAGEAAQMLSAIAQRFLDLRDRANIPLTRVNRLSREQSVAIVTHLLATPSGGLAPLIVSRAALEALNKYFALGWRIDAQGINAADAAVGAAGDISVFVGDRLLLAIEVTERQVQAERVRTTLVDKARPAGLASYLFFVTAEPSEEARHVARGYFGQGHEVDFIDVAQWVAFVLTLLGAGRSLFVDHLLSALANRDTPAAIKVAWNDAVTAAMRAA